MNRKQLIVILISMLCCSVVFVPAYASWTEYKNIRHMDLDGDLKDEIIIEANYGAGTNHYIEDLRIFKDEYPELKLIFSVRTLDSNYGFKPPDSYDEISEVTFTEPNDKNGARDIVVKSKKIYYKDDENKVISKEEDLGVKVFKWDGNKFVDRLLNKSANADYAETVRIGTVTVQRTQDEIAVANGVFKLKFHLSDSALGYAYIITSPYIKYSGYDGVIDIKTSQGLSSFPSDHKIKAEDFSMFAFFGESKSCIGVLIGSAGASGGSTQTLTFFDTKSNNYAQVETYDLEDPEWHSLDGRPIGFIEKGANWYFGDHATSLGAAARISKCYSMVNGTLKVDTKLEKALCQRIYNNIIFSSEEINSLKKDDILALDRQLAVKLLDKVYYGLKLGKNKEVKEFLSKISPNYAKEISPMLVRAQPNPLADYFPLEKGNYWIYQEHYEVQDESGDVEVVNKYDKGRKVKVKKTDSLLTLKVLSTGNKDNLKIVKMLEEGSEGNKIFFYVVDRSSRVYRFTPEELSKVLAGKDKLMPEDNLTYVFPLKKGLAWNDVTKGSLKAKAYCFYVEKKEDITVPAGTYKDCFKIIYRTLPDDMTEWFCPGIGVVKTEYHHHGTIINVTSELKEWGKNKEGK